MIMNLSESSSTSKTPDSIAEVPTQNTLQSLFPKTNLSQRENTHLIYHSSIPRTHQPTSRPAMTAAFADTSCVEGGVSSIYAHGRQRNYRAGMYTILHKSLGVGYGGAVGGGDGGDRCLVV